MLDNESRNSKLQQAWDNDVRVMWQRVESDGVLVIVVITTVLCGPSELALKPFSAVIHCILPWSYVRGVICSPVFRETRCVEVSRLTGTALKIDPREFWLDRVTGSKGTRSR